MYTVFLFVRFIRICPLKFRIFICIKEKIPLILTIIRQRSYKIRTGYTNGPYCSFTEFYCDLSGFIIRKFCYKSYFFKKIITCCKIKCKDNIMIIGNTFTLADIECFNKFLFHVLVVCFYYLFAIVFSQPCIIY